MVSRPKDWHAERGKGGNGTDYPLRPLVLSDIYTGRVLDADEQIPLRQQLPPSDPAKWQPSLYRLSNQEPGDWSATPESRRVGERTNPLTGQKEPRIFPKTYGCDGGVDYGNMFTLRSGTAAFYDKTRESGTVFLSGPRSGCTNSIIPSGGLLNVPYFYDGCTCSYPLPVGFSMIPMPESFEQWSSWGETDLEPNSIIRIGMNLGAPGDRMARNGTLWLDYPSIGGPSPKVRVLTTPEHPQYRYRHSLWMKNTEPHPWVCASMAEGLEQLTLQDIKPGTYQVRLYFAEIDDLREGDRIQTVRINGRVVLRDFDIVAEAGAPMTGILRTFDHVEMDGTLRLELRSTAGSTAISGIELSPAEQ